MARIVRNNGQYIAIKEDGSRVPINPSKVEMAEPLRPSSASVPPTAAKPSVTTGQAPQPDTDPMIVRNEQGVSVGERNLVKNWAANPEVAKRQLEEFGYDVRPYGKNPLKLQLAVRPRGKNGVWKVLDPQGFDWQDLLDLGGDLLAGGVQTASMVGVGKAAGLAKVAAASGVGSGLGEAAREGVGSMLGIKDNVSGSTVGSAAAIGGAVPVATKLASPIIKPVGNALAYGFERFGNGLRYAAARFGGVRDLPGMPLKKAIDIINNAAGAKVVPIADQARALHRVMMDANGGLLNETWDEVAQVNAHLVAAKEAGAGMDFRPVLDNLERVAGSTEGGMVERRAASRVASAPAPGKPATAQPVDKFDALFREVRENPEFRPSPEDAKTNPMLRKAVQDRDASFGAPPQPDRRVGQRRTFSDLPPERQKAEMAKARGKEMRVQGERRQDMGTAVFDFVQPGSKEALEDAARTQRIPGVARSPRPAAAGLAEPLHTTASQKQATSLLNFLINKVQKAGVTIDNVPLDLAHQLKRYVQEVARRGGAYADAPVEEPFARIGRDAAAQIRQGILDGMPPEIADDFAGAMGAFERKAKLRTAIINSFRNVSDVEDFLREVHGRSNAAAALHLTGLESEFGVSMMPELEHARAAEMLAKGGPGEMIKRHPIAAGAAIFHPGVGLGALGGLAAAPAVARGSVAAARGIRAGTSLAAGAAASLARNEAANAAGVRLLQESASHSGKGIASESQASRAARPRRFTKLY